MRIARSECQIQSCKSSPENILLRFGSRNGILCPFWLCRRPRPSQQRDKNGLHRKREGQPALYTFLIVATKVQIQCKYFFLIIQNYIVKDRKLMEQEYSPLITDRLPLDAEGYTKSFDIDSFDPEVVKDFYQKYGIVVFNNILSKEQIKRSIDDLWKDLTESCKGKIKRNDPETWDFTEVFGPAGFVNNKPIIQAQLCKNRSHPKVYKAFKTLYELSSGQPLHEPLLAVFDRGSLLRPSKNNPEWESPPLYHFDIHPWWWTKVVEAQDEQWRAYNKYDQTFSYWLGEGNYVPKINNFTKIQGVLGLSPTDSESGGFEAVCGFHRYIHEWCKKTPEFKQIHKCPQLMDNMQKIYQRAGSVIFFTRQLPHNIFPNLSENVRYAQYLRMAPESTLMLTQGEKLNRKKQVKKMIHKTENRKDPIVREVYMLSEDDQEGEGFTEEEETKSKGFFQKIKDRVGSLFG